LPQFRIYFTERMSVRKVAKRFGVATSFVEKLLKQLRETGDILPRVIRQPMGTLRFAHPTGPGLSHDNFAISYQKRLLWPLLITDY
jgi:hypothetical protein